MNQSSSHTIAEASTTDASSSWQRLAIVIHSLTGGGSEHVAAAMASHWADAGKDVTLITLDSVKNDQIEFSPKVQRVGLDVMSESTGLVSAILANRRRVRALRSALLDASPDRVISLTDRTNILTLLAVRPTELEAIVAERTDVRYHRIGRIWEWLRKQTYPQAEAVVVQTKAVKKAVEEFSSSVPVHVIPNAVPPVKDPPDVQLELPEGRRWFVAVGRLSPEKGFDFLIDAFVRVADACPAWSLVIVGDGAMRGELERTIERCNLQDRVLLAGWIESPWKLFPDGSIFVLPSHYEGFPNVLLEAMSHGMACVANDLPSTGAAEIITHGVDGLLACPKEANDDEDLAVVMESLAENPELQSRIAAAAPNVKERFSSEQYYARWESVLAHDR